MSRFFQWLKSVWAIVAATILGVVIGLVVPAWSEPLANIGRVYMSFLIMCVPPIMLAAISSSLSRLVTNESAGRQIKRMLAVFLTFMFATGTITVAAMFIVAPGSSLSPETHTALGLMLRQVERAAAAAGGTWADLFMNLVPENMFAAMVESNYPQLLFISILLGLLLGFVRTPGTQELVSMADVGFKMFLQAISWSTYALPFAIVGIVAGQVARTGFEMVFALIKLLAVGVAIALFAIAVALLLISRVLKEPLPRVWVTLRRPVMMGFGTQNSIAVMPLLMDALVQGFTLPRPLVNLVVPLSVLLARNGNVLYAGMMLMFAAQLYGVELTAANAAVLVLATVLGTFVGSGMPTIPFLTTLTIVAQPMGFPVEPIIPIFLAILPVLDPFGTAAGVTLHAAAASVIIGRTQAVSDEAEPTEAAPSPGAPATAS